MLLGPTPTTGLLSYLIVFFVLSVSGRCLLPPSTAATGVRPILSEGGANIWTPGGSAANSSAVILPPLPPGPETERGAAVDRGVKGVPPPQLTGVWKEAKPASLRVLQALR